MRNLIREVVYKSGQLMNVDYFFHPDLPIEIGIGAIKFWFQEKVFFVIVKPDDDSLEMTEEKIDHILEKQGYKRTHMSNEMPWKITIDNHVRWIWTLTNQQNYLDGLQFEFIDSISQKSIIIQMLAIASSIKIKMVY